MGSSWPSLMMNVWWSNSNCWSWFCSKTHPDLNNCSHSAYCMQRVHLLLIVISGYF